MKTLLNALMISIGLLGAWAAQAQALPADAPAGTTVQCKDGSYASPDKKAGACRGHKGIKNWYGAASGDAKGPAATATAPAAPAAPKSAGVAPATPATASVAAKPRTPPDPSKMAAAPGGGAGLVWANDETKVYHCQGDRYYGKTKKGEYLNEADAKAKGMHAARNKACTAPS